MDVQSIQTFLSTTAIEIGIKVLTEDIRNQVVRHANSCFFTMVAVDDDFRPTPVPKLTPETPDETRRYRAAKIRRELRKNVETQLRALQAPPSADVFEKPSE